MNDFEPSPLSRILELGQKADFNKVTSNCSYLMLFKNNPFPKIHQSTITSLRENYQSKEKISEILYDMDFAFPVITQSLTDISQNLEKMSPNNQIYSSIFLFYSFVAWYINYTKSGRIYPADVVLASLMNIKFDTSYEILAKSSFYFGFKSLIESTSNPLFDKYLPTLKSYFLSPDTLPKISGDLIMLILSHFIFTNDTESITTELSEILKVIIESTSMHHSIFIDEVVFSIMTFLTPYWNLNFDKESLLLIIRCFSSLLEIKHSENYSHLISTAIVPVVLGLICTDNEETTEVDIQETKALPNNLEILQDFTFPKRLTFTNGLTNHSLKNIYVENDCNHRFGSFYQDYFCLIKALNHSFDNLNVFIQLIIDRYNEVRHTKNSQHISLFLLFVLSVINGTNQPNKHTKIIFDILHLLTDSSGELFHPNITIFDHEFPDACSSDKQSNSLLELNSIRNEFLKNIVEKKNLLHNFLNSTRIYPNLMTEIIYRLTSIPIQIPIVFLDELMNYYRFMDITNHESHLVEITRESLFLYMSNVYSNCLFDDTTVVTSYFLCLMEDNLADLMSKLLLNYFSNITKTVNIESFVVFLKFVKINSINDKENIVKLIARLISLLRSIFEVKIAFSRDFRRVYDEIFQIISQIEITTDLMNNLLSLFIEISPEYEINEINAFLLEKSIINNSKQYEQTYFDHLLKLISVDNLHIYNSCMLSITYNLFSTSKFSEFIMDFLYINLLKDSVCSLENCKKCFQANFDCFLLDQLNEIKHKPFTKENEEKLKNLLLVYEQISNYFSSPSAILKFVSLLTPKSISDGKYCLSQYMPCFMDSLYKLVDTDYSIKVDHLTFNSCATFSDEFNLPSSFTICFWINCKEFDENEINIFKAVSLKDKKETIRIYMKSNCLNIDVNDYLFSKEIPAKNWTFISISIQDNSINIMFNLIKANITSISPLTENLSCQGTIGDSERSAEFKKCYELGLFSVLNLQTAEQLKMMFHNGVFSPISDPIFTFNNCYNSTLPLKKSRSIMMSNSSVSFKRIIYNFVFCLADLWKCDVLFPLFSIYHLPFENDENSFYEDLPYLTTEILTKCLALNPKLQNYFIESNKIPIISYLLLSHENITNLKLYHKFDEMYLLVSNKDLHTQIYFSLLTNILLVQKTNPKDHITILGKWLSNVSIFPKSYKRRSFSVLLSLLNLFYKYKILKSIDKSISQNMNTNDFVDGQLNLNNENIEVYNSEILSRRQILHSLLTLSANTTFSMDDFKELTKQCLYQYFKYMNTKQSHNKPIVTDRIELCLDLLQLMKMLVVQTPLTFQKMGLQVADLLPLHQIIGGEEKVAVHFIETILAFYYQGIFSKDISIIFHLGLIINLLATMKLTESFLTCLIKHASRSLPEMYVFGCWFLSLHETNNEKLQNLFISSLSTIFFPLTKDYLSNSFFLFWSVSLSNRLLTQSQQKILFAFMINILSNEWYRALPAIASFSEAPDETIMNYLELVLLLNSDDIEEELKPFKMKSFSPNDFDFYFCYSILFIIMRPQKRRMTNLEKMFVQSPFMLENYEIVQSESTEISETKKGYYNDKDGLLYGLRIDDENQWVDLEFAKKLFNQRNKLIQSSNFIQNNQKYIHIFSVLLRFISHQDPHFLDTVGKLDQALCDSLNDELLSPDSFWEIYDESFTYFQELKIDFLQSCKTFNTDFQMISTKIDDMLINLHHTIQEYRNQENEKKSKEDSIMTQVKRILALNQNESKYQWRTLLRNLIIEKGPWNPQSLSTSPSSFQYSRSLTLCSNLCPFLMKRKYSKKVDHKRAFNFFHKYDFHFWTYEKLYPNALSTNNSTSQASTDTSFTSILDYMSKLSYALQYGSHDNPQLLVYDCQLQRIDGVKQANLKIDINSVFIFILNETRNFEGKANIHSIKTVIEIDKNDISILVTKKINGKLLKLEIYTISSSRSYLLISEYVSEIVESIIKICQPHPNKTAMVKLPKITPEESPKTENPSSVSIVNLRPDTFTNQNSINSKQDQSSIQTLVSNISQRWGLEKCTNFDYLMFLNIFSGRSFNDLSQYPIFPWIIKNYSDDHLQLKDGSLYRDLSLPVGSNETSIDFLPPEKVVSYLSRICPFNNNLQEQKHTFTNIEQQYKHEESQHSSVEITPEFFFMPEFLMNDVVLPKWANNPLDFIYKHRKLLESDYVTSHLNEWIDFVFGYKQNDNLSGQIPCQLFTSPHLQRGEFKSTSGRRKKIAPTRSSSQPSFTSFKPDKEGEILNSKLVVPLNQKAEGSIPITSELLLAFFKGDSLYAFDGSLNVMKFSFDFDKQELHSIGKQPLFTSDDEYLTKISQIMKQNNKSCVIRCLNDDSHFYIFDLDSTSSSRFHTSAIAITPPSSFNISMEVFELMSDTTQEASLAKIECVDGQFIVVSNSRELSLLIIEIIEPPKQPKRIVSKRYMQFRAVPKCCAISSIFKTLVVASDDDSVQIVSFTNNFQSSRMKLSHIVDLNEIIKQNSFVPMNALITDGFGFIILYGKLEMSLDENESFIYVFSINGLFIRSQKIDGEIVNWTKWRGQKGFDYLALVIKKRSENDPNDITYKIAVCEAYYLKLDILNYRIQKRIVSLEFLHEKNALAIFHNDGNFKLISYTPDELYIE